MKLFYYEWQFFLKVLGCYLVVIPLEYFLSKESNRIFKNRLVNLGYGFLFLVMGGYGLHKLSFEFMDYYGPSRIQNAWVYTICYVLLTDFFFYCYHRLQHTIPLLWKVHALHHTDTDMNITTSYRSHILENFIQYIVVDIPVIFIMGLHPEGSVYAYYALIGLLLFSHLKLKFNWGQISRVIVTPQLHRIHHSCENRHRNSNFAQILPLYDILGRTYYHPEADEHPETGIKEKGPCRAYYCTQVTQ